MPETKRKNRKFVPNVRIGDGGMDVDSLRGLAEREPETFMRRCHELIAKGELSWENVRNLPKLFHALADIEVPARFEIAGQTRAIMASAFPLLSGALTIAGINAAYEAVPSIGQELVTELEDSKKVSEVAAITSEDTTIDRVDEGKDFPLSLIHISEPTRPY